LLLKYLDILLTLKKFSSNENKNIVSNAFVLGVTCLSSAFETMSDFRANLVILDECSQMTEPTSMLPILRFGAERLLLVGDPLQLPPTISTPCEKEVSGLDFTFFERMAATHIMPILLRTQYRCHPSIGSISNDLFYKGSLSHSSETNQLNSVFPPLPQLVFVDSLGSEKNAKLSFINAQEAESIVNFVLQLIEKGVSCKEMGIIALCELFCLKIIDKGQADYIRSLLDAKGQNGSSGLQISTVDAFQGAEKDLIVLSTIRTNHIGFIDDPRRINVALTRSKRLSSLI
jgi:superfamily I DNA and/or RNA helicase